MDRLVPKTMNAKVVFGVEVKTCLIIQEEIHKITLMIQVEIQVIIQLDL